MTGSGQSQGRLSANIQHLPVKARRGPTALLTGAGVEQSLTTTEDRSGDTVPGGYINPDKTAN
jgi:hypothetical protein